LNAGCVIDI